MPVKYFIAIWTTVAVLCSLTFCPNEMKKNFKKFSPANCKPTSFVLFGRENLKTPHCIAWKCIIISLPLQSITAQIVHQRPENPLQFMLEELEKQQKESEDFSENEFTISMMQVGL